MPNEGDAVMTQTRTYQSSLGAGAVTALAVLLALLLSVFATVGAKAATVQPTASNLTFTDADGNAVTTITNNVPYKITFDFTVPGGANAGDSFVVNLSDGFAVATTNPVALGNIAIAQ